jgi:glyoxylase-like metal-dependent hydrolase (beta-lactamase superfamily II)
MSLIFKQFRSEGGCMSFVLGAEGKVCLIDPRADEIDNYENFLRARGYALTLVIDTHTHADHYSATHLVAKRFGVPIAMGTATRSARAQLRLKDGEVVEAAPGLGLRVLETPGHTPDSVSLLAEISEGQSLVFTGDTLFAGGSGRTDFPGANAALHYDSIHTKLGALGDETMVLPGHDYSSLLLTTIGHERRSNPHWLIPSRDEFVRLKAAEVLNSTVRRNPP